MVKQCEYRHSNLIRCRRRRQLRGEEEQEVLERAEATEATRRAGSARSMPFCFYSSWFHDSNACFQAEIEAFEVKKEEPEEAEEEEEAVTPLTFSRAAAEAGAKGGALRASSRPKQEELVEEEHEL